MRKGVNGVKADISKPARVGRQDRKALRDLSKTGKPALSCASKAPTLKDKSGLRAPEPTKVGSKSNCLTEEELKRCQEWAKQGIEQIHFSGNDSQKLQQEKDEERGNDRNFNRYRPKQVSNDRFQPLPLASGQYQPGCGLVAAREEEASREKQEEGEGVQRRRRIQEVTVRWRLEQRKAVSFIASSATLQLLRRILRRRLTSAAFDVFVAFFTECCR
ncbi:hypothetical protein B296_00030497 [Ensete ventricosum]|uniref:Uncharacterized protein n=1 Tax=Ensete ventricosum TaxID=4639 RepID=A0A427AIR2_ENSVE|nr:hypothetical protein B296_00030497 [Ensete ventricosum]